MRLPACKPEQWVIYTKGLSPYFGRIVGGRYYAEYTSDDPDKDAEWHYLVTTGHPNDDSDWTAESDITHVWDGENFKAFKKP